MGEQFFGTAPDLPEKFGISVALQGRFPIPMAVGEKSGRVRDILVQFHLATAFKGQYPRFGGFKDPFKTRNIFGFKTQFDDTYEHLDEIYGYQVPVLQSQ